VQGIWPPCTDGSDINAVDRYFDMSIIATADDFGTVKLYNYPAASPKEEPHNTYHGHSSHVTNVQFTKFK
jgi:microtubule-associated protein-like 6